MKRLTLLRHAKSGDDHAVARDFDRPLNAKGRRAARAIGRHMRDAALHFDIVLASPAARVVETLQEVEAGYGGGLSPQWERRIYLATPHELLEVVHGAPESAESLLVVGHNPGLERLVVELTHDDNGGLRDRIAGKYPTGALAVVKFPAAKWSDVSPGRGEIVELILPRELD